MEPERNAVVAEHRCEGAHSHRISRNYLLGRNQQQEGTGQVAGNGYDEGNRSCKT